MVDNSGLIGGGGLETTVSLEAGENMSVGDNWFLGVDGKAYKNRKQYQTVQTIEEAYPDFQYGSAGNFDRLLFADSSANKLLWVAKGTGNKLWCGIGQVNPDTGEIIYNTITDSGYGLSGSSGTFAGILNIGTNKALALYLQGNNLYSIIIDYSGIVPSFGTGVTVTGVTSSFWAKFAYDSTNDKVLYAYPGGTNDLVCRVGTITGTSISWNAQEIISNNTTGNQNVSGVLFNETHSAFIVVYRKNNNSGDAIFVDCSGASISVHNATSRAGDGYPSAPVKLSNGDYYAYVHDEFTNEDLYLEFVNMTSSSTDVTRSLRLETLYSGDNNSNTAILDLGSGKVLVAVNRRDSSGNRSEYGYIATFDGTTATLVKSFPLPSIQVVKLGTGFGVYDDVNSAIELYDSNCEFLGIYDFSKFNSSMPRFFLNNGASAQQNPDESQKIRCTNGITIFPSSTSFKYVIETDNGKLVTPIPSGYVKETVVSSTTHSFPVKQQKRGDKPLTLTGLGIKPCESLYLNGDQISRGSSSLSVADSEYIGYCITDDTLIVNSNSSKET